MSNFHFSPRPNRAHEINWREWSDSAFEQARIQDKPILLGVSAVWCHWCHVMDETSYSDSEVIRLINERFIPIRVDNDARPDVNRRYNLGGWPTTAFLTPDGEVLTGGTYIPPDQMRGYLKQVSEQYKNSKPDILRQVAEASAKRDQARRAHPRAGRLSNEIVDNVLRDVLDNFDPLYGGFGDEPKFPHAETIALVLEKYFYTRDESRLPVVTTTLTKMASGGTYDQEAGGFFRYSTTRDWSVPHFEKMLEDNGKLLRLLVHAYQVTRREAFLKTIQTLTAYVNATLSDAARGGFYGSQDADEHYYALPLAERAKLPAPYIDHTLYTDWNALMVSAYFEAARVLNDASLREFALKTLDRLWNEMFDAGRLALFHFLKEGGAPQLPNQLSDLARIANALLDAHQTTADPIHLQRARTLADIALASLDDADAGAFWSEPRGQEALGLLRLPDKSLNENAAMAEALTRLYRLTNEDQYHEVAEKALAFFVGDYARYGFTAAEYALAVDHFLNEPVSVHIVGAADDAHTRALHAAAIAEYAPAKIVVVLDPARDAARLAQLGYPANDAPLAYVCVGQKCLAPISAAAGIATGMKQIT
ncbi:MAG: thioredoxin domain-containing protein [Chloroflexota bacterium]|nr:thioredoxin domain-containing protein [Chloroflexota bacterium]